MMAMAVAGIVRKLLFPNTWPARSLARAAAASARSGRIRAHPSPSTSRCPAPMTGSSPSVARPARYKWRSTYCSRVYTTTLTAPIKQEFWTLHLCKPTNLTLNVQNFYLNNIDFTFQKYASILHSNPVNIRALSSSFHA